MKKNDDETSKKSEPKVDDKEKVTETAPPPEKKTDEDKKDKKEPVKPPDTIVKQQISSRTPIPYLTPLRMSLLCRADSLHEIVNVTVNIEGQDTIPNIVYDTLLTIDNVEPALTREDFIRTWKTLILKRTQDVYTKVTKIRPDYYVRLDDMIPVPAPLGDLLYSLGSYFNREEGTQYTVTQPARPAEPEPWWTMTTAIMAGWMKTMKRFSPYYTIRQTPVKSDFDLKPLIFTVSQDSGALRSVRSKFTHLELTDGLVAFTHDELFSDPPYAYDNCNILVVESRCRLSISQEYVDSYKTTPPING